MTKTRSWTVENLDCASCANELEQVLSLHDGVASASMNYLSKKLTVESKRDESDSFWLEVEHTAKRAEPTVTLLPIRDGESERVYSFSGLDCAACALEVGEILARAPASHRPRSTGRADDPHQEPRGPRGPFFRCLDRRGQENRADADRLSSKEGGRALPSSRRASTGSSPPCSPSPWRWRSTFLPLFGQLPHRRLGRHLQSGAQHPGARSSTSTS